MLDVARRKLAAAEGNHVAAGGAAAEVDAAFETFDPPIRCGTPCHHPACMFRCASRCASWPPARPGAMRCRVANRHPKRFKVMP